MMTFKQYEKGLGDSSKFVFTNRNPDGRCTGDCSTRAISGALGIPYDDALDEQCAVAKMTHYGITDSEVVAGVLSRHGWTGHKIGGAKAGERRKSVEDIALMYRHTIVVIRAAHHWTMARYGVIEDIWNCSRKTAYGFYVKAD